MDGTAPKEHEIVRRALQAFSEQIILDPLLIEQGKAVAAAFAGEIL